MPDDDYADAILALADEIDRAIARAEERGLITKEIADELRRIAQELEAPKK